MMPSENASIWTRTVSLDRLNTMMATNMLDHLGIAFTEVGPDYLKATMPVDDRTRQPMGVLHGGASVVLAESLASVGANLCLPEEGTTAVGLEVNANHVRSVSGGHVEGCARPVHIGRRTQVWSIRISDSEGRLVSVCRLTLLVPVPLTK